MVRRKRSVGDYISDGFEVVSDKLGSFAKNKVDSIMDRAELRLMVLQDRIIRKISAALLFCASFVFIALGVFYLFKEFFGLTNTASFIIIGIVLFVIGFSIRSTERRIQYYG